MNREEQRNRMNKLQAKLKGLVEQHSCQAVFVPEIEEVQQEIFSIQQNCSHEFKKGKCKWCGLNEPD